MPKKAAKARTSRPKRVRIKQVRSGVNRSHRHQRTLRALGFRHHQDVVELPDNPSIRGMLYQVRHLVEVAPVEGT